jgi:hypothetical protein
MKLNLKTSNGPDDGKPVKHMKLLDPKRDSHTAIVESLEQKAGSVESSCIDVASLRLEERPKETSVLSEVTGDDEPLIHGFNLQSLKLPDFAENPIEAERIITNVPIRKPRNDMFVRCHPDPTYEQKMLTIEIKSDNGFYVVSPSLRDVLVSEPLCVPRPLVPYVDADGELCIWPIRLPGADGRIDDYNRTAYEHADRARNEWGRIVANRRLGSYDFWAPRGVLKEPKWPAMNVDAIYEIALRNRVITSLDHAILKALRGEV